MEDHQGLAAQLSELCQSECRTAMEQLGRTKARHKGIHEARNAIRRLRSALFLGKKAFGADLDPIDRRLKRIATSLSPLRDAHVLVVTATGFCAEDAPPVWTEAVQALKDRRRQRFALDLGKDPEFQRRRRDLQALGTVIQDLPWAALRSSHVASALRRSARRVVDIRERLAAENTVINRHRLRRRVRRLRMQIEACHAMQALRKHDIEMHKLGALVALSDAIGTHQDLLNLRRALGQVTSGDTALLLKREVSRQISQAAATVQDAHAGI